MKSAEEVQALVEKYRSERLPIREAVWNTARACVGWPYVFGAEGQLTTKDGVTVRKFDCQGFTEWCLLQFGIDIRAAGATSQWNKNSNWAAKGLVSDGIPKDQLVCLFYRKKDDSSKMAHTGFGYNGQTCECSVGVQYFERMNKKWTHWAIPKGVEADYDPDNVIRPTLRRGSKGPYVKEMQEILARLGYDLGSCGIDSDYGKMTQAAVSSFQKDHGLTADGICGKNTWTALLKAVPGGGEAAEKRYTVTIRALTSEAAKTLCAAYPNATMAAEEGGE